MIDEADRLRKWQALSKCVCFDAGGIGLVLIGMPGVEKRLARYPQFYSRTACGCGQNTSCRDLVKIALTVPSGNPVLFAIFRAPIPASWFSERTVRTVSSGRGGLPSLLPLTRATLSPAMVRSDILALSCLASVANIEIISSLNGPVESSHCS